MAEHEDGRLRSVAWGEVFPWIKIFRSFRIAIQFRLLVLAAIAVVLTAIGWWLLGSMFRPTAPAALAAPNASRQPTLSEHAHAEIVAVEPAPAARAESDGWSLLVAPAPSAPVVAGPLPATSGNPPSTSYLVPVERQRPLDLGAWGTFWGWQGPFWRTWEPLFGTWEYLSRPWYSLFRLETTFTQALGLVLVGLWTVAVWAFFGGAITRAAAVELALGQRAGTPAILKHACVKWRAYCAAPLVPLFGALLLTLAIAIPCLLLRTALTATLLALVWPVFLVLGFLLAVLLVLLAAGWPLMWANISTEGVDSFDGISRSYHYIHQRPLHALFYLVVAGLIGALGWLLVANFAACVIWLTNWAASWGSGSVKAGTILVEQEGWAGAIIGFWNGVVRLLAVGYLYSYFWTAWTAIYLLLRYDVDATEMDEVFVEEDHSQQAFTLPPIKTDEVGAPVVDESGHRTDVE